MSGSNRVSKWELQGRIEFLNALDSFLENHLIHYEKYPTTDFILFYMLCQLPSSTYPDKMPNRSWKNIAKWCNDRRDTNYVRLLRNTKFVQVQNYSYNNFIYSIFYGHVEGLKKIEIPQLPVGIEIKTHNIWVPEDIEQENNLHLYNNL